TRGLRAQVTDVAEHLGQRHEGANDLDAGRILHGLDLTAPRVEVADDVAHVLLGRTYLDRHERLEQNGARLARGLLVGHRAGDLERHLRGVDVVRSTIDERRLDAHRREAGEHADLHRVLDARVDRPDVLTGYATTGDGVHELVGDIRGDLERLKRDLHLSELTRTTGLLLVRVVVLLDRLADGLAVRNLGLAHVGLDVE